MRRYEKTPFVCLSDAVAVCLLTDVQGWALLCLSVQKLQDKILESSAITGIYSEVEDELSMRADSVLIHPTGSITFLQPYNGYTNYPGYTGKSQANASYSGKYETNASHSRRHTQSYENKKETERRGVVSIGETLLHCCSLDISTELRTVLNMMSGGTTDLIQVLQKVERYWRRNSGISVSQVVSKIYRTTLNTFCVPRPLHDSKQNGNILLEIRENGQVPTRPVQYRQSTCSTFTKPYLVNQHSKPAQVGQPGNHRLVSRTGDSELDTVAMKSSTVYKMEEFEADRQKRYGRRLEFRPHPQTEKPRRKFGDLDPNKSYSTSAIDQENAEFSKPMLKNSRVKIEPEFVTKSSQPAIESVLGKHETNLLTAHVKLITGAKLKIKIDENTRCEEVLSLSCKTLGLASTNERMFCICFLRNNEYFYIPPTTKLVKTEDENGENENPRKSKSRRRSSLAGSWRDGRTFYLRFVEFPQNLDFVPYSIRHIFYLQLRNDFLAGLYRMSLDEYFSIGASALKADLRFATTDSSLGFCSKGSRTSVENTDRFLLVDYLPVPVIKYTGEKRAKDKILKMARNTDSGKDDLAVLNKLINALSRDCGLASFSYLEANQTIEARIGNEGISLIEKPKDLFCGSQLLKLVSWVQLREVRCTGENIQFYDAGSETKVKLGFGSRSRSIAGLLERWSKLHSLSSDIPDRGRRFRELYQKLRNHVVEPALGGGGRGGGGGGRASSSDRKKRRSLPSFSSVGELKHGYLEAKTRCSIRRLKHYGSMANNLLVGNQSNSKLITDPGNQSNDLLGHGNPSSDLLGLGNQSSDLLGPGNQSSDILGLGNHSTENLPGYKTQSSRFSNSSLPSSEDGADQKKLKLDEVRMCNPETKKPVGHNGKVPEKGYRYRVYLENDDYEDNDSSMENSRVLKNSSLEHSKVLKNSSLENSTVLKNLTLENSRLFHLDEPELGQGQPGKPLPVSRKGSITFGNTKLNSENPFPKNGVKQNLKQKSEDQIKPKERKRSHTVRMGTRALKGSSMENLLRQGSERIEKTKSSFIQFNPFSSKLFHSCENITESFIHDLKPFPGTKLITRRSASGLAKETSGLVKGASGSLLDTKSASKTVSEHSLSNIQILGETLDSSLSVSLLERFENMDTAEWEPTRTLTRLVLRRNKMTGRLGVRITQTPGGIYVESIEPGQMTVVEVREQSDTDSGVSSIPQGQLKPGDKILEVDGTGIEGLGYKEVLDCIQRSGDTVQFLVSQLV